VTEPPEGSYAADVEAEETPAMKTLLGAAVVGATGTFIAAVLGVIRTKALAVELEPAGIGLYGQILSLLTALSAASGLGLGLGTTRTVAEARTRRDRELLGRAISVSIALPLAAAVGLALVIAALSPLLAPGLLDEDRELLIVIAAGCVPFVALQGPVIHAIQGFRDVTGAQLANLVFAGALTIATIVGAIVAGLDGAVVALLAGNIAYAAAAVWRLRALARMSRAVVRLRDGLRRRVLAEPAMRTMLLVGVASLAVGGLSALGELAVRTTVLHSDSASGAGIFQALHLISNQVVGVIVAAVVFYTFTTVSEAHTRGDQSGVRRSLDDAVRLSLLLTLPVILAIGLLRDEFISALLSDEFGPVREYLPGQLAGDVLRTVAWALAAALVPLGMTRAWVVLTLASVAAFAGLGIALVPPLGIDGAVIGYVAMWGTGLVLTAALLVRRGMYAPSPRTIAALVTGGLFIALIAVDPGGRAVSLALVVVGSATLGLAATADDERRALLTRVRARLGRS
jgi:O-antigen/teichoic acid export membrane protein